MRISNVFRVWVIASVALLLNGAAVANQNFDKATFEKLLAEGKPVVVDFYAPWCPTCRTQETILKELANDPTLKPITVIRADYDYDTLAKRLLRVNRQSTFVVFKDGKEIARSTGQTNRQRIIDLFKQAL
ncbi:MAG: thioredoxin [Burkholderiales bacterium]|nr:MAG: thioredoxin [Betaproteobacteria bacterium]TAG83893.1 MAG: thioredoxin [Burkholderiales bacterium]